MAQRWLSQLDMSRSCLILTDASPGLASPRLCPKPNRGIIAMTTLPRFVRASQPCHFAHLTVFADRQLILHISLFLGRLCRKRYNIRNDKVLIHMSNKNGIEITSIHNVEPSPAEISDRSYGCGIGEYPQFRSRIPYFNHDAQYHLGRMAKITHNAHRYCPCT